LPFKSEQRTHPKYKEIIKETDKFIACKDIHLHGFVTDDVEIFIP
jgi:hypothetical protein